MENSVPLLGVYFCIDHPDNSTPRRKPGSGMFLEASKDHKIELKNSVMIGDSKDDIQVGKDLGMDTILVLTGRGEKTITDNPDINPTIIVDNLKKAADWILNE